MVKPASDTAPEQFGPYEVYERLGLGGMATVHRAKKRGPAGFERSVALKRMLSHLSEDQAFVDSFIREAKVSSLLQHPNIAQVYDFGRISGTYYIAMELVSGFDVRKLLRYANRANEAIPMPVLLSVLGELCDALDYAHTFVDEAGQPLHIVHRDVSPSNLIVAHTGHLKVIDFGIAKANSRQLHTESGQVKGKLGYMSPEVALGLPVGSVSDLFSVGVVAWELATASPLFSARTDFETMRKIREEPISPPSRFNPAIPPKLDSIILAALQREPEDRVASAHLFRKVLDEIAAETNTHVSARSVAEWMTKFVQPDDSWARAATIASSPALTSPGTPSATRNRTPSGRATPLPPEPTRSPVTKIARTPRPGAALQRSKDDIQLASEIWGDDAHTVDESAAKPAPDFHVQVATPAPTEAPSQIRPRPASAPQPQPRPLPLPVTARGKRDTRLRAEARSRRRPLWILGALAIVAGVLAAVLVAKRSDAPQAALRFEIEPAGASVTIAGRPLAGTSPLDTTLAPGVYPVTVELDGYEPWTSTITVREGDRQTIRVALDKEDTEIAIHTPPTPAVVEPTPDPRPEPTPEPAKPEPAKPEPAKPEPRVATKPAAPKREPKRTAPKPEKVEAPKAEPPKVEPPKVEPKPEPPPVKPVEPPVEIKPARTPVVSAGAVTKLSGDVPTLRAKNAEGSGDVLAKMCIDDTGRVSSVKIVKSNPEIADELRTALASWRYKPYQKDGKSSPVCFPLSLRVVVKSG
jgi:serine/threonine protein kinase